MHHEATLPKMDDNQQGLGSEKPLKRAKEFDEDDDGGVERKAKRRRTDDVWNENKISFTDSRYFFYTCTSVVVMTMVFCRISFLVWRSLSL